MRVFNSGDKVVEKGKKFPIMIVLGNSVIKQLPEYLPDYDNYICRWTGPTGKVEQVFHKDELELISRADNNNSSSKKLSK